MRKKDIFERSADFTTKHRSQPTGDIMQSILNKVKNGRALEAAFNCYDLGFRRGYAKALKDLRSAANTTR